MAKYEVIITETLEHTVTVEADSLKEAKEKGYEVVMNGPETDFDTESLGTQLISAEREDGEDEDGEDEDGEDEDGEDEDGEDEDGADPRRCR